METLPQYPTILNHIDDAVVSDCCGASVMRLNDEMFGCNWCGHFCTDVDALSPSPTGYESR